jgi:hypothetical protein
MKSVLHNMWFSDDPHFHLDGVVSKQNVWFWAVEHLKQVHKQDNYGEKLLYGLPFHATE